MSAWTSCCKGPILKVELEENYLCVHTVTNIIEYLLQQRFDIIFGKNNYEILKTPIPKDDPLKWKDTKSL